MTSVEVNHIFLVLLLLTILYFAWMDVALYYKLQSEPGHLLLTQNYLSAKLNQKINHSATQPPPDSSSDLGTVFSFANTEMYFSLRQLWIVKISYMTRVWWFLSLFLDLAFDAFNPISLKLLMLDHANHYIYYPLGSWIDKDILQLSNKLTFITPDMISWSHVLVACVAGTKIYTTFSTYEKSVLTTFGNLIFATKLFWKCVQGVPIENCQK